MANAEQLGLLRASIAEFNDCIAWNQWRRVNNRVKIDLLGADLSAANLNTPVPPGARYINTHLSRADLSGADLTGANLSDTRLEGADLFGSNLMGANLSGADLSGADLTGANLSGANFTNARMYSTHLGNLDLRGVVGLGAVEHRGPSNLASNTLYASRGEIPDVFLRGCGMPDDMIGFVHAIAGAIQYYSAFISYNHEDEAFATRLYNDLQANNVRCWKYTEDVKIGNDILARVDYNGPVILNRE